MVINLTNTGWETDSTVPLTVLGIWTKRNDLVEDLLEEGIIVGPDVIANTLRGDDSITGTISILVDGDKNVAILNDGKVNTGPGKDSFGGEVFVAKGYNNVGIRNNGSINTGNHNDSITGTVSVGGYGSFNNGIRNEEIINIGKGHDKIHGAVSVRSGSCNTGILNSLQGEITMGFYIQRWNPFTLGASRFGSHYYNARNRWRFGK